MSDPNSDETVKEPKSKRRKRFRSSNKGASSHCSIPGQTGCATPAAGKQRRLNDIPHVVYSVNNSNSEKKRS